MSRRQRVYHGPTWYEIEDLPRLGWIVVTDCGEENMYFTLPDGSVGFVKHGDSGLNVADREGA